MRATLRATRGLCNWHAGMLLGLPGAAFGAAILSADLLTRERARADARGRAARARRPRLTALRQWLRRPASPEDPPRRTRRCFACEGVEAADRRHLDALLALVGDPRFEGAFAQGDGLCMLHLARLVGHAPGSARAEAAERLVDFATARWRRLEAALERFIAKRDYRTRAPFTEEEARAWGLALEMLAGAQGVFGNGRPAEPDAKPAAGRAWSPSRRSAPRRPAEQAVVSLPSGRNPG